MSQTGVLSQWVGARPVQSISEAPGLPPPALVLAPPSAPPSGQAKKVAKRAVDVITNGGMRGSAGRISVLTAQLADPLIRPLLEQALPRELRAKVQIVNQEKAALASVNGRRRSLADRAMHMSVITSAAGSTDTKEQSRDKATALGVRTRVLQRGTRRRAAVEQGVASYALLNEKASNPRKDLKEAHAWLHRACEVRSADKRDVKYIPIGDKKAVPHQRRVRAE